MIRILGVLFMSMFMVAACSKSTTETAPANNNAEQQTMTPSEESQVPSQPGMPDSETPLVESGGPQPAPGNADMQQNADMPANTTAPASTDASAGANQ